jgi:ABC-type multidrug transport system fused ATPase/permease subunit
MRYREELPLVLNKVSFSVKAGEKIGKTEERISLIISHLVFLFHSFQKEV